MKVKKMTKPPRSNKYFEFYNPNPFNNYTGDCSVRALAKVLDKSWDDVYDEIVRMGKKYGVMPNNKELLEYYIETKGFIRRKMPVKTTGRKYTVREFCSKIVPNIGKPIFANVGAHHVVAICDNKVHDIWDSSSEFVGKYWVKED